MYVNAGNILLELEKEIPFLSYYSKLVYFFVQVDSYNITVLGQ